MRPRESRKYRVVGRLALWRGRSRTSRGGGRRRSRATIGDADRSVLPDVAATEEGVRGEDGALLNVLAIKSQPSLFFEEYIGKRACGLSGGQIGVRIHASEHVKKWSHLQDHTSPPSSCMRRLFGSSKSFCNGRSGGLLAQWGGRPREDRAAGTRREDMTVKRAGLLLMRFMREGGFLQRASRQGSARKRRPGQMRNLPFWSVTGDGGKGAKMSEITWLLSLKT